MTSEIDELYADLATEFMVENASKYSFSRLVEIGKGLFEKHKLTIQMAVCSDEAVRKAYESYMEKQETYTLLAALADVVAALSIGLSPVLVSKLLLKIGLENTCKGIWDK